MSSSMAHGYSVLHYWDWESSHAREPECSAFLMHEEAIKKAMRKVSRESTG